MLAYFNITATAVVAHAVHVWEVDPASARHVVVFIAKLQVVYGCQGGYRDSCGGSSVVYAQWNKVFLKLGTV